MHTPYPQLFLQACGVIELSAPTHHTDRKRGGGASSWRRAKETEHFVCNVNHYSFLGVVVYSSAESAVSCTQLQEFRLISSDYGRTPTPCSRVARMTKRFVFPAPHTRVGNRYRQEQRERNAHRRMVVNVQQLCSI